MDNVKEILFRHSAEQCKVCEAIPFDQIGHQIEYEKFKMLQRPPVPFVYQPLSFFLGKRRDFFFFSINNYNVKMFQLHHLFYKLCGTVCTCYDSLI